MIPLKSSKHIEGIGEHFHIPQGIYLLNHSLGCLPKVSQRATQLFIEQWAEQGSEAWPLWLEEIEGFNQALAKLFNSQPDLFCPQNNVTSAVAKILYSLKNKSSRQTILMAEQDFPSLSFLYQAATQSGLKLKYFPKQISLQDLTLWDRLMDGDVQWLHITHVTSGTSDMAPVAELIKMARQRDIITVVDVAQSAGIIPIDVHTWNPHFMVGSSIKWLCGGPGAAYLWVHPDILPECTPQDRGWFSHADPFEFDPHHFEFHKSAKRYWGGTPSVQPYMLARRSIELIVEIGVQHIRQHNLQLLQRLKENLGIYSTQESGGTFCFPHLRQMLILEALRSAQVHCDLRAQGIRLSPHIYNNEQDIDRACEMINPFLKNE